MFLEGVKQTNINFTHIDLIFNLNYLKKHEY